MNKVNKVFSVYSDQYYPNKSDDIKEKVDKYLHMNSINIKYKTDSIIMKTIGFILSPFVNNFMSRFTTTIGRNIYVPSREWCSDRENYLKIICHEVFHISQEEKEIEKYGSFLGKISFRYKYLFPQINALPSVLACVSLLAIWFSNYYLLFLLLLVFLVYLVPKILKAKWRYQYEVEGYSGNVLFWYWYKQNPVERYNYEHIVRNLQGSNYYWTNSNASDLQIKEDILEYVNSIKDDDVNLLEENRYLFGIKQIIMES